MPCNNTLDAASVHSSTLARAETMLCYIYRRWALVVHLSLSLAAKPRLAEKSLIDI